jgi:hypothetical protein
MEEVNMDNQITPESKNETRQAGRKSQSRFKRGFDYYLLWVIVILLLGFNLTLGWFLLAARQQVETYRQTFQSRLVQAGTILENIKGGSIEYVASIDENIPISINVPLDYEVSVPINMVVPINTTVSIPLLGAGGPTVDVPISTSVPVNTTVKVPVKMTIPFNTNMPIKMDVPVSIKISDTFLAANLDEAQVLLAQLSLDLDGLLQGSGKIP